MHRQVALDTETTGKSDDGTPGDHRIIEIGCVEIVDRQITGRELQFYIDPERPVDEEATRVHGMSWDDLRGKPKFADIAPQFIDFIRGSELLIHNARFDVSFMDMEFGRLGLTERTADMATITDTITVAKAINPNHQVNLDNLCKIYEISNKHRTKHGALLDAQILAEVYLAMTGGQRNLEVQDVDNSATGSHWQRPAGTRLKLMPIEKARYVQHVNKMASLAQAVKFKTEGEGDNAQVFAGSNWGEEYLMPYLEKGKEESKGDYKKRQKAQLDEKLNQLLSDKDRELLKFMLAEDKKAHDAWVDRVLGRTT